MSIPMPTSDRSIDRLVGWMVETKEDTDEEREVYIVGGRINKRKYRD